MTHCMVLIGGSPRHKMIKFVHNNHIEDFCRQTYLSAKKAGWSPEELAEHMYLTRQSVLKWEGAQSIPHDEAHRLRKAAICKGFRGILN